MAYGPKQNLAEDQVSPFAIYVKRKNKIKDGDPDRVSPFEIYVKYRSEVKQRSGMTTRMNTRMTARIINHTLANLRLIDPRYNIALAWIINRESTFNRASLQLCPGLFNREISKQKRIPIDSSASRANASSTSRSVNIVHFPPTTTPNDFFPLFGYISEI